MAQDMGIESAVTPPAAPVPVPKGLQQPSEEGMWGTIPDYLEGIRARFAPTIQKLEKVGAPVAAAVEAASGGVIPAAKFAAQTPQGQSIIQGAKETATDPEKRLSFVTGLVQPGDFGGEIPGLEGIRAKRIWYHGTSAPVESVSDLQPESFGGAGLTGVGAYITDKPEIAASGGYGGKVGGRVLGATVHPQANILDAEQPLPDAIAKKATDFLTKQIDALDLQGNAPSSQAAVQEYMHMPGEGKNPSYMDALEAYKRMISDAYPSLPAYEGNEMIMDFQKNFQDAGYHGVKYSGGKYVGSIHGEHQAMMIFPEHVQDVLSPTVPVKPKPEQTKPTAPVTPQSAAEKAGVEYRGVQKGIPGKVSDLHIFQDPKSGTSVGVNADEWGPEKLQERIDAARARMAGTKKLGTIEHKQTASIMDNMNNPDTRYAAARHEAGHAIVGEALSPGSVSSTALNSAGGETDINPPKNKKYLSDLTDDDIRDMMATSLAGGLSEYGGTTRIHSSGDVNFRNKIIGTLADSLPHNLARLATGKTSNDVMLKAPEIQAEARAKTQALLADPKIQRAIDGLTEKIADKGKLSGKEIRKYLKSVK